MRTNEILKLMENTMENILTENTDSQVSVVAWGNGFKQVIDCNITEIEIEDTTIHILAGGADLSFDVNIDEYGAVSTIGNCINYTFLSEAKSEYLSFAFAVETTEIKNTKKLTRKEFYKELSKIERGKNLICHYGRRGDSFLSLAELNPLRGIFVSEWESKVYLILNKANNGVLSVDIDKDGNFIMDRNDEGGVILVYTSPQMDRLVIENLFKEEEDE